MVELLTVIGIIGILIALLFPAFVRARSSARIIVCASNIRQICQGLFIYAGQNHGNLPPNISATLKPRLWYDSDRIGRILTPSKPAVLGSLATCPDDVAGQRSYAMNVWASSAIDSAIANNGFGECWKLSIRGATKYILVAEKWSSVGSATVGWTCLPTIAATANPPGRRFGGGAGISPLLTSPHFGQVNSELPFQRHRTFKGPGQRTEPIGRVNLGYADGHVALKSSSELYDASTGLSTLDSWWNPRDAELNK